MVGGSQRPNIPHGSIVLEQKESWENFVLIYFDPQKPIDRTGGNVPKVRSSR